MSTKRFVFDSTELVEQRRLEGTHFRLLVHAQKLLGDRICIPEVVLREYVRHTRERLVEQVAKLRSAAGEVHRIVGRDVAVEDIDPEKEARHWESWLRSHLKALAIEILPLPEITVESVLERDLSRRKPFHHLGKGMRDALIWESLLADARRHPDAEIVFVSSNSSDFGDKGTLHPDLQADVAALGVREPVVLAPGFKAAIDAHVEPRLPPSDPKLKAALQQAAGPLGGLKEWIVGTLSGHIGAVRLPAGLPVESLGVERLTSVNGVRVLEARTVGGDQFAEIEADVVASLTLDQHAKLDADGASPLLSAGRVFFAQLMLTGSKIVVRFAVTIDPRGIPTSVDVWEARWNDDSTKLFPIGWTPTTFGS